MTRIESTVHAMTMSRVAWAFIAASFVVWALSVGCAAVGWERESKVGLAVIGLAAATLVVMGAIHAWH